jgi:hypothetical protein
MRRIGVSLIAAATLVAAAGWPAGGVIAAQQLAQLRAEWGDLETWSRYLEGTRESELGLGLQVSGPSGLTFVAFLGRLDVRNPTVPPREITVQVGAGRLANPNLIRRPVLIFVADDRTTRRVEYDLTGRLNVDEPAPGAAVENGIASMRAAEFVRLTEAESLQMNMFGFEAVFRPDHLRAMNDLARKLRLVP